MKVDMGAKSSLYPMPTVLAGALVGGKPNYITIAHVGILDLGTLSLGMHEGHFTNAGIRENGTFSVNLPSEDMVKVTDRCGLVSGKNADKGALFKTFYGKLKSTPMMNECPVNMECRLVRTVDLPRHDALAGEVVAIHADEDALDGEVMDLDRVRPLLFVMSPPSHRRLGPRLAGAWSVGKDLKK